MSEKCIGRHYSIVGRGGVSRWNHTYKNGFMNTRFLSWPYFVSSVG